jgi:hypothetical protein
VAPNLLAKVQVQGLESFFSSLVTGETGPFMVTPIGTVLGLGQIGLGLMQPVKRAVHPPMMPFAPVFTTALGSGKGAKARSTVSCSSSSSGSGAISVNGNWRLTFEFRDGNAFVRDYEVYH